MSWTSSRLPFDAHVACLLARQLACALAITLLGVYGSPSGHAEELVIDFSRSAVDPLIEIVPGRSSVNRSTITSHGMRVLQAADPPGGPPAPPNTVGAKTMVFASGDFSVTLDWTVNEINEPGWGWGQGLLFAADLDDSEQTQLQMSLLGKPGRGIVVGAARTGQKVSNPIKKTFKRAFGSGKFRITREGDSAVFSIIQDGQTDELARLKCPADDLISASVWCTRQKSGNTKGDYLLRSLTVNAEDFFTFQESRVSQWSGWKMALAAQILGLTALVCFSVIRNQRVAGHRKTGLS